MRLLKMIHNAINIHKKEPVIPRIIVENNRGNVIHLQNIATMDHIDWVDIHPTILYIFNKEVIHLIIMVTLLVVYLQYQQIMFQHLKKSITRTSYSKQTFFLLVILVKDRKGLKENYKPSHTLKKRKYFQHMKQLPPQNPQEYNYRKKKKWPTYTIIFRFFDTCHEKKVLEI